jgi:hypothetical protein
MLLDRFLHQSVSSLVLSIALGLALSSCSQEPGCNAVGAENFDPEATVDDGSCIEVRDKFLGSFVVTSDCIGQTYQRTIEITSERFLVRISAISDTLGSVNARVSGQNIIIDPQIIRNGVTLEGAGLFDSTANALSLSYRITDMRSGTEVIHNCLDWCVKN